jgi:hypothetical protein
MVRRLLGDAAEPTPMPAEVTRRLDDLLSELATERASGGGSDDELAAARAACAGRAAGESPADARPRTEAQGRARSRWARGLMAAALVAAVAAGAGPLVRAVTGGSANDSSAGGAASSTADSDTRAAAPPVPDTAVPGAESLLKVPSDVRRLSSATLASDVQRLLRRTSPTRSRGSTARGCALPEARPGDQLFAVRLDGRPATLVVSTGGSSGARAADVYLCDHVGPPAATTTVPAG